MGQMLTAKQVAEVKGCSYQYVQRIIKEGKLQAQEILNDKNRKTYLVPLEALDEELQQKWYQMNLENPPEEISTPEPVTDKKAVDHFSESERQEIDFWISLVEQWQQYRMKPGVTCKADVDKKFVALCGLEYPDKEISVDILYRKWKAVKENDLDGLIDKRGKWKKGTSSIDDTIWQAFLYFYLDESQHPIQKCLDYTKMWAQEKRPDLYTDIPSYSAFYRRLNNEVPEGVKVLGREHQMYKIIIPEVDASTSNIQVNSSPCNLLRSSASHQHEIKLLSRCHTFPFQMLVENIHLAFSLVGFHSSVVGFHVEIPLQNRCHILLKFLIRINLVFLQYEFQSLRLLHHTSSGVGIKKP